MHFNRAILFFLLGLFPAISWAQLPSLQHTLPDSVNRRDKDSLKQGMWINYFAGGATKEEIIYKNDRKNGLYLLYYHWPNCFKFEASYRNDTLEGEKIEYYRSCRIKLVQNFHNGVKEGVERKYNYRGVLVQEAQYTKGKLKNIKTFAPKPPPPRRREDKSLEGYLTGAKQPGDSSVMQMLSRVHATSNSIVVADVTGSMYRYIGQLLIWYKANLDSTALSRFVFFNDGDGKFTYQKKPGKAGGIYTIETKEVERLRETMEEAINNGDGGDLPENNMEGIIKGMKRFKHTDQVVMIADRLSDVRDIALLRKVKVPVQVILCGNKPYTNAQYLDIAYRTKGSIQNMDGEIKEKLLSMKEDDLIELQGCSFRFKNGKFRRVLNKKLKQANP